MQVEFLIVGHGIAGITIAEQLQKQSKSYFVIDKETPHTSSKVAAGLFNPITGRKMKQTWLADKLFPYLKDFYTNLEFKLDSNFFHPRQIYRPFLSIEDQNEWVGSDFQSSKFVDKIVLKSQFNQFINDPFGGLLLSSCGFVDLKTLIDVHEAFLRSRGLLLQDIFDYSLIKKVKDGFTYKNISFEKVIFCDGPISNNPFFNWLPYAPVKGEILHIKTKTPLPDDVIFNRGVFIVKNKADDYYRVGSTYEWKNLDWKATEKAKNQLINKLNDLLTIEYSIVDQVAGIRPASKDRRPLIGEHPENKNIFIFNGLGTKGVSLAPYMANQLISNIILGSELDKEVNISRYYSLY
jgi:glycine/D-amino acid oxidase-like deaminating enzyme